MATDEVLIRNCLKGKPEALGRLYDLYAPVLFSLCLRYVPQRAEAEDLLQEAFIRIFENLKRFNPRDGGSFEGWMKRIAVNHALNYIRTRNRHRIFVESDQPNNFPDVVEEDYNQDDFLANLTSDTIHQLIAELPEGYRTVFNLYVIEEYSHKEIAELIGCSENTSKTQLLKARNLLKKKISELQLNYRYER